MCIYQELKQSQEIRDRDEQRECYNILEHVDDCFEKYISIAICHIFFLVPKYTCGKQVNYFQPFVLINC